MCACTGYIGKLQKQQCILHQLMIIQSHLNIYKLQLKCLECKFVHVKIRTIAHLFKHLVT